MKGEVQFVFGVSFVGYSVMETQCFPGSYCGHNRTDIAPSLKEIYKVSVLY